jgi:NADH dehydrogenase [ubiquinone] 1 alpha subcomplex assembly factor 7
MRRQHDERDSSVGGASLAVKIRDRIRRFGPITVAEYMALALAHPEHGYYRTRDPLGAAGDFITAPEISQMFGELIGLWCAVEWQRAGAPAPVRLVELGPGRGTLMADALRAARTVPAFRDALRVHLVETSPALRQCQRRLLDGIEIAWHENFDGVPAGPLLLIANEFFDALPIRQYVRQGGRWHERLVGLDGDRLRFLAAGDPAPEGIGFPNAVRDAPDGAIIERCPAALALAAAIGGRIAREGIAALIVDYGPERTAAGDSLQAVRGHCFHDVLADPGEADLTAHVDFESLAAVARDAGAAAFGPIAQGTLLQRLGIATRAERLAAARPAQAAAIAESCRRLIGADGMGTLFKALALLPPGRDAPAGFEAS